MTFNDMKENNVEKTYHLGKGINVGMHETGSQENNIKELEYSDNLLDFFDRDSKGRGNFLRTHYKEDYYRVTALPEYEEFLMQFRDKDGDIVWTPSVHMQVGDKILSLMDENSRQGYYKHISDLKTFWKPKVEYIKKIMHNAEDGRSKNASLPLKDKNGDLNGDFLVHNFKFSENIEEYESRKDLGILASEWFGQTEVMEEGFMCSFFVKTNKIKWSKDNFLEHNVSINLPVKAKHPNFTLILDASNQDLKKLLENDFFEYMRNNDNTEYLKNLSAEQISLFEGIAKQSRNAKKVATYYPDWVAIPGGVPLKFAIGLIARNLKTDSPDFAMCQEIADVFDVPLLNSELDVVYSPSKKLSKAEILGKDKKEEQIAL